MRRKSRGPLHGPESDFEDDLEQSFTARPPIPRLVKPATRPKATTSFIEDLRRWAPDRFSISPREPVREATGRPARIVHKVAARGPSHRPLGKPLQSRKTVAFSRTLSDRPAFQDARSTIVCLKRKARRETLFALKRTGKGARTPKKLTRWSFVRC